MVGRAVPFLWLCVLLSGCATPPVMPTVASVQDGDTLTLSTREVIRLADIDAPESCQLFGGTSTASMIQLCQGRPAAVTATAKDRYGRTVARVACSGTDVATHQVTSGLAWVEPRYAPKDSPLYGLQSDARRAMRGLWADPSPVPPWEFRRANGQCKRHPQPE